VKHEDANRLLFASDFCAYFGQIEEVLKDPDKKSAYDLGFNPRNGSFDPTFIDPSLLDPDQFIMTFSRENSGWN